MKWLTIGAVAVAAAGVFGSAGATTLAPLTFGDQVASAEMIFRGRVLAVDAEKRKRGGGEIIVSRVRFETLETYKGEPQAKETLEFLGGRVGDEEMLIEGMPRFAVGDEVVLFVGADRNVVCPVVGWAEGALEVVRSTSGQVEVVLPERIQSVANFTRARRILKSDERMELGEFQSLLQVMGAAK